MQFQKDATVQWKTVLQASKAPPAESKDEGETERAENKVKEHHPEIDLQTAGRRRGGHNENTREENK